VSGKVSIVLEKDDNGYYVYSPELPGCHSQGDTKEEALRNIQEAVELYLEDLSDEEKRELISKEIDFSTIPVTIA